jgi:hypothetical protein
VNQPVDLDTFRSLHCYPICWFDFRAMGWRKTRHLEVIRAVFTPIFHWHFVVDDVSSAQCLPPQRLNRNVQDGTDTLRGRNPIPGNVAQWQQLDRPDEHVDNPGVFGVVRKTQRQRASRFHLLTNSADKATR